MVAVYFSGGVPFWYFLRVVDDFGNEFEIDMRTQPFTGLTAAAFFFDGEGV
jgi:hypothetical protein